MSKQKFIKQSEIDAPIDQVFAFHETPEALEILTPPWEKVEVLERTKGIQIGSKVLLKTKTGFLWQRWEAEHIEYIPNQLFIDVQRRGPFACWLHQHRFVPTDRGTTLMIDEVDYELPMGWLGEWVAGAFVRKKLQRLFDYRHEMLAEQFKKTAT
ncbi:MAG: SRPBCC family protein [Acidobacteriota bacterium]